MSHDSDKTASDKPGAIHSCLVSTNSNVIFLQLSDAYFINDKLRRHRHEKLGQSCDIGSSSSAANT